MKKSQKIKFVESFRIAHRLRYSGTVTEYALQNFVFDEPGNHGPFEISGREYITEPLNTFSDDQTTDVVLVFGSQTGKTGMLMAGMAYMLQNSPGRAIWVMPSIELARTFSRTRWQAMLRASSCTAKLIPTGAKRHAFKTLEQVIGSSIVNFAGSNSPGSISSNPCRYVIQDEVDKFNVGTKGEADASDLADQRAKRFSNPKRIKTSTPTLQRGLIWQAFLKGDQRRYFVPCPHCNKEVVFAWSKEFTVLQKTGVEAYVKWSPEAKNQDGSWNYAEVERTAHFECPHCAGKITEEHKTRCIREGVWRATAKSPVNSKSYHLSSLYATSSQTSVGKLAVKFIQAKRSLLGLQGFINGDLAEPFEGQQSSTKRRDDMIKSMDTGEDWRRLMTFDCQAKAPHFWFIVNAYSKTGDVHTVDAGNCDTWDELRAVQERNKVVNIAVMGDSGFGAKSDADVYRNCARFCETIQGQNGKYSCVGWMPSKGFPAYKRWRDKDGNTQPWYIREVDPYGGTSDSGQATIGLFEFSGYFFEDILEELRTPKKDCKWTVEETVSTDEFWQHMDSKMKVAKQKRNGAIFYDYEKKSESWPDHIRDCMVMNISLAYYIGIFQPTINNNK